MVLMNVSKLLKTTIYFETKLKITCCHICKLKDKSNYFFEWHDAVVWSGVLWKKHVCLFFSNRQFHPNICNYCPTVIWNGGGRTFFLHKYVYQYIVISTSIYMLKISVHMQSNIYNATLFAYVFHIYNSGRTYFSPSYVKYGYICYI